MEGGGVPLSARSRLAEFFPWPFIGVVVLLVILIFLTPNLLSGGAPTAGSLPTEAQLVVDRAAGSNVTHLYVESLGNVRYASISIQFGTNVSWPVVRAASIMWANATTWAEALEGSATTSDVPFAVNVSAIYVDAAGSSVAYEGAYAFNIADTSLAGIALTPDLANVPTTPVASLPIFLLLASHPYRTGP
ncbi:MAG: hypothetical protein ACREDK_01735 [Thermoplasmata archaeon]